LLIEHSSNDQGRHRKIPGQRHGARHRPHLRQKAGGKIREKIFDVIENTSGRLEEVEGIGPERRRRIKAAGPSRR